MERSHREKRKIKLIKPGLQLRMVGAFVGLTALGFLMQSLLLGMYLAETASKMPEGGNHLMAVLPGLPIKLLLVTFGMFVPLIVSVGILVTFRVAGPVYRLEQYLESVIRGEQLGPCRLRGGDELGDLCEIINRATEPLRTRRFAYREQTGPGEEYPSEIHADEEHPNEEHPSAQPADVQEGMRAAG